MKPQLKNPVKNFAPVFLMLMAMFLLGFGCNTSKPVPDPLAGWQKAYKEEPNQAITKDYQNYIQNLSPKERKNAGPTFFYKDGSGQHAIDIVIGINGRDWRHILIYDKEDKRIKTIKYATGYYAS
jgi:hypothetical protein